VYNSLGDQPNKLQEWFLPGRPCVVLAPNSYSGRILDEEEAHTLLSAGAAALSHLKLPWPVYIPVHDALRDAYRGIFALSASNSGSGAHSGAYFTTPTKSSPGAAMNNRNTPSPSGSRDTSRTIYSTNSTNSGAVVRLESDSVHSNRNLPLEFCTLSGQLAMFAARLRWHAPRAASLCSELASVAVNCLEHGGEGADGLYNRNKEEEEDQNLAAAAVALTVSGSSPLKKTPPRQRRPSTSGNNSSDVSSPEEQEISVCWEMRRSYLLSLPGSNNNNGGKTTNAAAQGGGISGNSNDTDDDFELLIDTWDDDAVWRPWAAEDDPIERLEIDALWSLPLTSTSTSTSTATSSSSFISSNMGSNSNIAARLVGEAVAVEQNDGTPNKSTPPPPPSSASAWRLAALRRDYQPDDGRRPLILLQSVDQRRHFLRLQSVTELPLQLQTLPSSSLSSSSSFPFTPPSDALPGATSFSAMLNALLHHTPYILNATDASHLTSDDWWLQQGNYVPPLTPSYIIQDAIRDIFQAVSMPPTWPGTGIGLLSEQLSTLERFTDTPGTGIGLLSEQLSTLERFTDTPLPEQGRKGEENSVVNKKESGAAVVGKGAPLNSLSSRLALQALRLGNPRAIAMLWMKFLREIRFAHWETNVPLPRMKEKVSEQKTVAGDSPLDSSPIDENYSILHQKLQIIDLSIRSKLQNQVENTEIVNNSKEIEEENDDEEGYTSATEHSSSSSSATTVPPLSGSAALEGEKALHFLETLPPAAVYAELLAVGFASSLALLHRAPAATLPAVAAQLAKVKEVGNAWLGEYGVSVSGAGTVGASAAVVSSLENTATATATDSAVLITPSASESNLSDMTAATSETGTAEQQQNQPQGGAYSTISVSPAVHAMIHSGLGPDGMNTLVQILACVEQTTTAGQSLLQRLNYSANSFASNEFSTRIANGLIAKALDHGSGSFSSSGGGGSVEDGASPTTYGAVIDLNATEFALLANMATGNQIEQEDGRSTTIGASPAADALFFKEKEWTPSPFWNEWCISITNGDVLNPLHRLFVRQLPAELRVATVITSEMS
jgi:hypothetical protein